MYKSCKVDYCLFVMMPYGIIMRDEKKEIIFENGKLSSLATLKHYFLSGSPLCMVGWVWVRSRMNMALYRPPIVAKPTFLFFSIKKNTTLAVRFF